LPEPTDATFDLLIIGGGINGAGIARDAAGRDLRVLLVEQAGLANYTSSASSKLIHGGLRYLEYGQFRLVREALSERERLLAIAPHLVRRQRFVLPHNRQLRPAWMIRAGLFLYDRLGRRSTLERSTGIRLQSSTFGAPLQPQLTRGFGYSDCVVDDSRLVLLNALDAGEHGALIRPQHRFVRAERVGNQWRASIDDLRRGLSLEVKARVLMNAAGPWVGEVVADRLGLSSRQSVRLVKGSHIVVPRLYEGSQAYVLQNEDRRIVFVIPYEHRFTLIGTTDLPWTGAPGPAEIDAEEARYLCTTVNQYFRSQIAPADVVWSYAGLRPLCDDAATDEASVTRDYVLEVEGTESQAPLLSVYGGKITTYRRLAEHALEHLRPWLSALPEPWTAAKPLPGGDIPRADLAAFVSQVQACWPYLGTDRAARMAGAYGTRIYTLLAAVSDESNMGENFGGGLTEVEVNYLAAHEWALTAEDVLWRHTKLGLLVTAQQAASLGAYMEARPR